MWDFPIFIPNLQLGSAASHSAWGQDVLTMASGATCAQGIPRVVWQNLDSSHDQKIIKMISSVFSSLEAFTFDIMQPFWDFLVVAPRVFLPLPLPLRWHLLRWLLNHPPHGDQFVWDWLVWITCSSKNPISVHSWSEQIWNWITKHFWFHVSRRCQTSPTAKALEKLVGIRTTSFFGSVF